MRRPLLFCLLFFLTHITVAQLKEIKGNWVTFKIEMKDGSKVIDRYLTDSSYFDYSISSTKLCSNTEPTYQSHKVCSKYKLLNKVLKTSKKGGFIIEKAQNDTLILSEYLPGYKEDKLKRLYLIRKEIAFNTYKNNKSKHHTANRYYTPQLKSNLALKLNKAFKNKHSNFFLRGTLLLDLRNKKTHAHIKDATTKDSLKINLIKKTFEENYKIWNLKKFKGLDTLEIPFVLKNTKSILFEGFNLKFFTDSYRTVDPAARGNIFLLNLSEYYFSEGIRSYSEGGYVYSILNFTECYYLNPIKIDALYNRAAIYFHLGDQNLACKDWEELSNRGQTGAQKFYKKNCHSLDTIPKKRSVTKSSKRLALQRTNSYSSDLLTALNNQ